MTTDLLFFALEGADGSGKTTLAHNLRRRGVPVVKTPPALYESIRSEVHLRTQASLFFYLSSICYVLEEIPLGAVLDRCIFSTLTHYVAIHGSRKPEEVFALFDRFAGLVPLPRLTFFLALDYEERMRRLDERNENDSIFDRRERDYDELWQTCMERYSHSPKIILDATHPPKQLMETVLRYIKQ